MKSLDKDIRMSIEEQIDEFFKEPEEWEDDIRGFLTEQGIEPSLETILSLVVGLTMGQAFQQIKHKFNRGWTKKEARAINALMQRRALELRHLFLSTRIIK